MRATVGALPVPWLRSPTQASAVGDLLAEKGSVSATGRAGSGSHHVQFHELELPARWWCAARHGGDGPPLEDVCLASPAWGGVGARVGLLLRLEATLSRLLLGLLRAGGARGLGIVGRWEESGVGVDYAS